jgi:hypothetical protein
LHTPSSSSAAPTGLLTPQQKSAQKKKIQSSLKSFIHKYGELMVLWLNDSNQIKALLASSLPSLYSNCLSINKTFLMSDRWKILMKTSGFEQILHMTSASLEGKKERESVREDTSLELDSASLLHQRLVGLIIVEIEGALLQTKSFLLV